VIKKELGSLLLIMCATPVCADTSRVIAVRFETRSSVLRTLWAAQEARIRAEVQTELVTRLEKKDELRHWVLQPGGSANAMLVFSVEEPYPEALQLGMEVAVGQARKAQRETWLQSDDLKICGYPSAKRASAFLLRGLQSLLLERHGRDLEEWVSRLVPLTDRARWLPWTGGARPRMVLGLPWAQFEGLSESVFLLECGWPTQGRAYLESSAVGLKAIYMPDPQEPPFDGLVVVPRVRRYAGQDVLVDQIGFSVTDLRPERVFLFQYVQPGTAAWRIGGPQ
jgi:hypothetical protein